MGSSIAWFSTLVRRTASSARVSRLSVLVSMMLTRVKEILVAASVICINDLEKDMK